MSEVLKQLRAVVVQQQRQRAVACRLKSITRRWVNRSDDASVGMVEAGGMNRGMTPRPLQIPTMPTKLVEIVGSV